MSLRNNDFEEEANGQRARGAGSDLFHGGTRATHLDMVADAIMVDDGSCGERRVVA